MRFIVLVCLLLLPAQSAQAKWLRAESDHFVVYADDTDKDIYRFSDQLERYHSAMAFVLGSDRPPPSPSNRVTVYVVDSDRQVRQLYGDDSRYIQGFYVPRAGGSLAIVPRVRVGSGEARGSMITLLHEYAHHFLIYNNRFPMPRWLSEGGAEFFASASFGKDGGVGIGRPAQHRGPELFYAIDVTAEDLLDPDIYEKHKSESYDAFYGKSWLLYHYLTLGDDRPGQLGTYVRALVAGMTQREAALEAFGDFDALEKDLDAYMNKRRMIFLNIPPKYLSVSKITVRPLSEGEAAMMPVQIRSKRGVDEEMAAELVVEARKVAARYPSDAAVLSVLAETEFDAGNNREAITAADAALAIDSSQVNAYVQKGYAMFELAEDADDLDAAYKEAFKPFQELNRLENDHPLPLIYFYRGFRHRGVAPSKLAVDGLEWAAELAPFDLGLRMAVASQQLSEGRKEDARKNLIPIAYNPHGGGLADVALKMIEQFDGPQESPEEAAKP